MICIEGGIKEVGTSWYDRNLTVYRSLMISYGKIDVNGTRMLPR